MKCPRCDGTGDEDAQKIPDDPLVCRVCDGTGEVCSAASGDWGHLPAEPCRYCRKPGGVYFLVDDGPEGRKGLSPVRCDNCGRSWTAGEATA